MKRQFFKTQSLLQNFCKFCSCLSTSKAQQNFFPSYENDLDQACTTYSPRAKWGPQKLLIWPAKPKILGFKLLFLIMHPLDGLKHNILALGYGEIFFGPAMRFELGTHEAFQPFQFSPFILILAASWYQIKVIRTFKTSTVITISKNIEYELKFS